MCSMIVVVDYGMGNLRSVSKALAHVCGAKQKVIVSSNADDVENADYVVFPGQGAAKDCMAQLQDYKLEQVIKKAAIEKPFLGICMGLQVLLTHSEENKGINCMNLIAGNAIAFANPPLKQQMKNLKIPHMGWNQVRQQQPHPLWHKITQDSRFYFVHSYYASLEKESWIAGTTHYGINFTTALAKNNLFAVQFHPEKSAHDGLQLLKNFCQWNGQS